MQQRTLGLPITGRHCQRLTDQVTADDTIHGLSQLQRGEYRYRTTDRYSQLCCVHTRVMSEAYRLFGPSAVKSCLSKLSATGYVAIVFIGRLNPRKGQPFGKSLRIKRTILWLFRAGLSEAVPGGSCAPVTRR